MAVADLNLAQLSSFCSTPQASISTLIDAPTTDLVLTLLRNISSKATEYNELRSESLRAGVELEAAVRGQETRNRALKTQIELSQKEAREARQQLQEQGTREWVGLTTKF